MYNANKIKTFTPILPAGQGPTFTKATECVSEIVNDLNGSVLDRLNDDQFDRFVKFLVDSLQLNDLTDGEYTIFEDYTIIIKHMTVSDFEAYCERINECKKIKEEFAKRGYEITLDEAEMIWKEYCVLKYYASWLPVGEGIDHHTFKELMELDVTKEILNK